MIHAYWNEQHGCQAKTGLNGWSGIELAIALNIGSWLSAIFVIFSALVWLVGGFLVTSAISNNAALPSGFELIPSTFWPMRAVVSALGVVGAVILVLSRPSFFRVISIWFASELALLAWLYATGFLVSQFDSIETVRSLAVLQFCGLLVVLFAWMKQSTLYRSRHPQE